LRRAPALLTVCTAVVLVVALASVKTAAVVSQPRNFRRGATAG